MHTLTLARRRIQVLVAKAVVMSIFSVVFMAVSVAVGVGLMYLGLAIKGIDLGPQTIYYVDTIWRVLFYAWGFNMFALILAFAIRNQVGSLVAFFFVPGTIESLLGLLLKSKAMYLPFTMLGNLLNNTSQMTFVNGDIYTVNQSQSLALLILYVVIGWAIVAYLFVRRDAN